MTFAFIQHNLCVQIIIREIAAVVIVCVSEIDKRVLTHAAHIYD